MDVLLKLGIVLAIGLVGGKIAGKFKLPNVSGYLVAGLFLGPSFSTLITPQDVDSFAVISEVVKCPPCQDKNLNFLSEPDISF